jgi:GTP pyrophosphokinase
MKLPDKILTDSIDKLEKLTDEVLYENDFTEVKHLYEQWAENIPDSVSPFGLQPVLFDVQTAIIYVEEIGLNRTSVICMLIKYLFFNSFIKAEDVTRLFGEDVSVVLKGLRKVNDLYSNSPAIDSDNFRVLLMLFAEDMRVIFILIADRINMMRKIKDLGTDDDRKKIAKEASDLYAPLAHKLGLYLIKSELEDLALKYLEHDNYYMIKEKLNATKKSRDAYVDNFLKPIEKNLTEAGLKFHTKGRTKSIHSIWQKMKKQKCRFEDIYDLFAIRIILQSEMENEKQDCWKVYSIVTDMYVPNPKRLRDWLSVPKSNGYESLHTTVMGPDGKWVEIQIRSERMDEIAERGVAAHWRYKGVKDSGAKMEEWLKDVRMSLELNDSSSISEENQFKVDAYQDDVFVFTPKGDLLKLPQGASVLDFAYMIHTNVGSHCAGGKVNGKNVPLRTKLKSGDQVEILTKPNQTPKRDWLSFAKTAKARAKIKQQLNEQEMRAVTFAKEALERKFKNKKVVYDEAVMMKLIKRLGYKHVMDFYKAISEEVLDLNSFIDKYIEAYNRMYGIGDNTDLTSVQSADQWILEDEEDDGRYKDMLVIDKNIKGVDYSLAKCCNPIYGDNIFGFVTSGRGIKIHRSDCPNAARLKEMMSYRIIPARWAGKGNSLYPVTLIVVGNDDIGIVNNITSILSKEKNVLLRSINIKSAEDGLFFGTLTVQIDNTNKLKSIIKKIKTVKGVKDVTR